MTTKISLPHTTSAQLEFIAELSETAPVQAIPQLAFVDRKVTGWLRLFFFSLVRIGFAGFLLLVILSLMYRYLPTLLRPAVQLVRNYHLGIEWETMQFTILRLTEFQDFSGWIWVGLFLSAGLILFNSKGVRKAVVITNLWPGSEPPALGLQILLRAVAFTTRIIQLILLGYFVIYALLPVLFSINTLIAWLNDWRQGRSWINLGTQYWSAVLVGLALLGLVVYFVARRKAQRNLVWFILLLLGSLGLVGMTWAMLQVSELSIEIAIIVGLCLLYPIGLAVPLSQVVRLPYFIFRDTLYWFLQGIEVRQAVGKALHDRVEANRARGGGDAWSAVCKEHLLRCQSRFAQRSYGRPVGYMYCPQCQSDENLYRGVECRALTLDRGMTEHVLQRGTTLWINGLDWLPEADRRTPPIFDALVIQDIDEYTLEKFIVAYGTCTLSPDHKSLNQIPVQMSGNVQLQEHELRLIAKTFSQVLPDYDAQVLPNPYPGNLRRQDGLQKGARNIQRGVGWVVRAGLLSVLLAGLILGGILALIYFADLEGIIGEAEQAWNQISRTIENFNLEDLIEDDPQPGRPPQVSSPVTFTSSPSNPGGQEQALEPVQPTPTVLPVEMIAPSDGARLILIPAGTFEMGNPSGASETNTLDETPAHLVTLAAFYIDQYEVTNTQYEGCVSSGACKPPESDKSMRNARYYGNPNFANFPVIKVTWEDAQAYCTWVGRRLPSEAEWEKAARWDPQSGSVRRYPWGDQPPDATLANFAYEEGDTSATGSYPAGCTTLAVCDLAGNVWEWTADWYAPDYYRQSESENPRGPLKGPYRVLRGGGWGSSAFDLRSTERLRYSPTGTRYDAGFRCAMEIVK